MNKALIIIIIIVLGIIALVFLPRYFLSKNGREAAQEEYEKYLKKLSAIDKKYVTHQSQLMQKLQVVNYWLKTGNDPNDPETEARRAQMEDRYRRKLMTPQEAKEYEELRNRTISQSAELDEVDEKAKALRKEQFVAENLKPCDVEQVEMEFTYDTAYGECIYYCVTPEALEKKYYKDVLFFTTSRPNNIPLVYPFKYEGATMLSLYKHPAQAIWFLTNWKKIREAMEYVNKTTVDLEDTITDFGV